MEISDYTISAFAKVLTGDKEISPYKSGPELVSFFNQFGFDDVYGQGFPSRWFYTENKLNELNSTEVLKGVFEAYLDPRNFFDTDFNIEEVVAYLNDYLKFDRYKIKYSNNFYKVTDIEDISFSERSINWTTEEQIGDPGGFGAVYKSYKVINDERQSGIYAKKELKKLDEQSIKRFQKEVRILKKCNHSKIIKVIDQKLDNNPYYYIMSLYDSSMHSKLLELKNDVDRLQIILNNIFEGIEYLHEQGIYHRDLKPANILINSDEDLVISDLGLGVDVTTDSTRLTGTGQGMGTRFYTAPEQWDDAKNVDEKADIYSLGCIIYVFFSTVNNPTYIDASTLPVGIDFVVNKATKNNKEDRFKDVREMRKAFNSAIDIIKSNDKTDFETVLNNLNTSEKIKFTDVENLVYLLKKTDDPDIIHEVFMKLDRNIFRIIVNHHFEIAKKVTGIYLENVTNQSWPFSYTDDIGNKCFSLFNIIDDAEIKAMLLYIVIQVGVDHNRFHVMRLAERILKNIDNSSEAFSIVETLKSLGEFQNLKHNIRRLDLDESLLINELGSLL